MQGAQASYIATAKLAWHDVKVDLFHAADVAWSIGQRSSVEY
jgi:hypothetical protein